MGFLGGRIGEGVEEGEIEGGGAGQQATGKDFYPSFT